MRMRLLFGSIAALLLARIVLGCSWVDPDQCWPNTSGGFGGSGTIPIGAGVGATTTGDFPSAAPPAGPLASGETPNPCVTPEKSGSAGSGSGNITKEQQAEIALAHADPLHLALGQGRAAYGAYAVKGLVEGAISDPSTADEVTVAALIDIYAPTAWDQAAQWQSTLDPSVVPAAQVKPKYECQQQFGCDGTNTCKFDGYNDWAYCVLTGCGDGRCGPCPSLFDLDKLIVKGWCSYTCMINYQIVGMKIHWKFALNGHHDECWKFEKPVPCEGVCGP